MRKVVLCADDYGLTEGISRGILELAEAGRISATSAMTNMPDWRRLAQPLRSFASRIGVGLHLNFTTAAPLGPLPSIASSGRFPAFEQILGLAMIGRLPRTEIRAEVERQLDAFEEAFGAWPAFVDGHQHVHILPGIRRALWEALAARGLKGRVWLRDPSEGLLAIVKRRVSAEKALVASALALGFRRAAKAEGFATNEGFSGFSPFDLRTTPERVIGQALLALGPRPVVMVHPGHADESLRALDPVVESRPLELAYLRSEAFAHMLQQRELELTVAP